MDGLTFYKKMNDKTETSLFKALKEQCSESDALGLVVS